MQALTQRDIGYLNEALSLARKGEGRTLPNPMVGALVVRGGRVVGRGYHRKLGGAHAEIEALRAAGARAQGATLYVTLEPCGHFGRTPPCAHAILRSGIRRVVCIMRDPNPRVAGKGFSRLRRAGVMVSVGGPLKEAEDLNEGFFFFHNARRPFVAIKFAASLDGKLATRTGDSKWITNARARAYARALRGGYQAILVGINTVLRDDPHLGVRRKGWSDPLRVVLDSTLRIPQTSRVLRDTNVLILTTSRANPAKKARLVARGVGVVSLGAALTVRAILKELTRRGIVSVFVEGGASVLGSFVDAGVVDKAYIFHAPLIIGGDGKGAIGGRGARTVSRALRLTRIERLNFGDSTLTSGYPTKR